MAKQKIYYAGFVDGKIYESWGIYPAVYCKRKYARNDYDDVRPVRIVEVPKKIKRKK